MIAVDTNVLVRYLVEDDARQAEIARAVFEERLDPANPAWISILVVDEAAWVLRRNYGAQPADVRRVIADLLAAAQLRVEAPEIVRAAIALEGDGLADAIIHLSGGAAGCASTVTFDREFARQAGVELLA